MSDGGTTRPSGSRRLGATDGATHQVVGLFLAVAGPATTLLVLAAVPRRAPEPFLVMVLAQVVLAGYLGWLVRAWATPTRRPGPADAALVVVPLLLDGFSTWLVLGLAESYGIRGSAVPRVQQGIAFPADLAYLASLAALALSALAALVLLVALLRAGSRRTAD